MIERKADCVEISRFFFIVYVMLQQRFFTSNLQLIQFILILNLLQ